MLKTIARKTSYAVDSEPDTFGVFGFCVFCKLVLLVKQFEGELRSPSD
jgi:hypothetical protein